MTAIKKNTIKILTLLLALTVSMSERAVVYAQNLVPSDTGTKVAFAEGRSDAFGRAQRNESAADKDAILVVLFVTLVGLSISSAFYALLKQT